jgi:hypothetical protein
VAVLGLSLAIAGAVGAGPALSSDTAGQQAAANATGVERHLRNPRALTSGGENAEA